MSQGLWPNSSTTGATGSHAQIQAHRNSYNMGKPEMTRRKRCDFDNIICSPFLLTSISIAVIGWVIAFIASIAANARDSNFSHFAWWAIMYQFCVITGIVVAVLFGATDNYQMAICAFLASALSFTSSTANALIYSNSGAQEAAAAGHIFLSITNVVWILYFGSTPYAAPHAWVDGLSLRGPMVPDGRPTPGENGLYPSTRYGTPYPKSMIEPEGTQLAGPLSPAQATGTSTSFNMKANRETMGTVTTSLAQTDLNFTYRAKAIYSYDANPEDPNEISFTKGEILEVAGKLARVYLENTELTGTDISGKWFQAKNVKGDVGIAPSNYLTLITN